MIRLYPDTPTWPANILRFHVAFDRAMDVDRALDHVGIERIEADGQCSEVEGAIVDLVDGLWNPEQTLLTVLFHPGRVKAGLWPHAAHGRAIRVGARHRIVVKGTINTTDDNALGADVTHDFLGTEPIVLPIAVPEFERIGVERGTDEPIRFPLDRPWDWFSVQVAIRAFDESDLPVAVRASMEGRDLVVRPIDVWSVGTIRLVARNELEDVCGNRIGQAFETRRID